MDDEAMMYYALMNVPHMGMLSLAHGVSDSALLNMTAEWSSLTNPMK